ncbi:MAG: SGNH/GDSL hydrolase family protein [Vicinamibacterales bacterium]
MPDWIWHARAISDEPLLFVADGATVPAAALLFTPTSRVRLTTSDRAVVFVEDEDYTVDRGRRRLELTPASRVPFVTRDQLVSAQPDGDGFMHVRGDPARFLRWAEGDVFHRLQVAASYAHAGDWPGHVPASGAADLPGLSVRLAAGLPLTVAVTGDSISEGYNASAFVDAAPKQPPYATLVATALRLEHGSPIALRNLAVAGTTSSDGWGVADDVAATAPHLVIVAFGMNDAGYMDAAEYQANVRHIVATVRRGAPDAEFVLVAPMLPHPDWHYVKGARLLEYRDALAELCGAGVVLADVTRLWADVLTRKSVYDLTGNGINHPNDFGHRLYAQCILARLSA